MKLPISAALLLLTPAFPLMPVEAAPLLALDAGQEGTKEQRQALAKAARRMFESEREGDREGFDKHEAKLVELLKAMGAFGTEAEAVALVRSVFEEFDPDALQLLDAEMEEAPGRESQSRLDGLHSALTAFMVTQNRYPTTQEGLRLLITGGEMQVPYIDEYMLLDG
ncbi:MAG: type II secretion system protein GspG, partial [Planctomycetota bacterium]|nr:type II secretion system protein GspG [Planctomycetota bacterium]